MKKIFLILSLLTVSLLANSQTPELDHFCGTAERMNAMQQNPQMAQQLLLDEQIRQQEALNPPFVPKGTIYRVPVVFHVLHNGGPENVSEEQIFNALEVITRDFRKQNADTSSIIPEFKPIAGDAEIEFVLATIAPNGECFRGYTRTQSPLTFEGDDGGAQVDAIRNGNDVYQGNWPSNKYLNVFVVADAGGAGGYTNYPSNFNFGDMNNGIWILHTQFGEIGTSGTGAGRSLTHECGHWFNLAHTWGSSNTPGPGNNNCSSDDNVNDTPLCEGVSGGRPLSQQTCGSLDNVQNYMDYSLACQKMYTDGQVSRMRTAIQSSVGGRNNLWTTANLNATGANGVPTLCHAQFNSNRTSICAGESIEFFDDSYNAAYAWTWTFQGGTPASSSMQNPTVTYTTPGIYTVTLEATDGATNDIETKTNYIRVVPASTSIPFLDGFESYSSINNIDEWEVVNDNGNGWELSTTAGLNSAKSARIINYNEPMGSLDELVASPVDLSGITNQVTLSFRYAYKRRNANDDDWLRVYATNDCGLDWNIRKTLHGAFLSGDVQSSQFVPSSENDWTTVHVTNLTSSYWVDNFRYKFQFESGGGNNMYLDNINIYEGASSDDLVSGSAGIDELTTLNNMVLYPNPANNEVNIKFNVDSATEAYFTIQDISGKQVQKHFIKANEGSNLVQFDTNNMSNGVYFMVIELAGAKRTMQFMVK